MESWRRAVINKDDPCAAEIQGILCLNLKRTNKFKIITTTTPTVGLYHYHRRDRDLFQAEVPGRPFF